MIFGHRVFVWRDIDRGQQELFWNAHCHTCDHFRTVHSDEDNAYQLAHLHVKQSGSIKDKP